MTTLRHIAILVEKDLRIEARGRQTIGLVMMLGVLIVVVLALGLGPDAAAGVEAIQATAILWVAYLFAGAMCFEKTMGVERQDDALAGLLLAPVDRGLIYLGKLIANLALMLGVAVTVTPVGVLLFRFDLTQAPLGFAVVMGLGMLGFAAVGTLFSAAMSWTRLQGGLLAILIFPMSLPLVVTSTQVMNRIFESESSIMGAGLGVLVAFDAVFLVASWLVFELLLEP
jgi:heme exporter protein B